MTLHRAVVIQFLYASRFTGNKCDLEDLREVKKAEAEALSQYLPEVLHVVETSAKDNTNIDSIFFCLASELKVNPSFTSRKNSLHNLKNLQRTTIFFRDDTIIAKLARAKMK